MFGRVLVPLDGSERAEQALAVAATIARATHGSVILLQVADPVDASWPYGAAVATQDLLDARRGEMKGYLLYQAASDVLDGVAVTTIVAEGRPAEGILTEAEAQQADVIVICSHGRTGLKRWVMGSVAQKVARHSRVPVLVLREGAGISTNSHPPGFRSLRVLVALDGSSLAETALSPAASLSISLSAPLPGALHLVRVIPERAGDEDSHYGSISALQAQSIATATTYLNEVKHRLQGTEGVGSKLALTSSVIVSPDIASSLIATAESGEGMEEESGFHGCDVIALATHGRSGLERWMLGSVTARVLGATRLPLLILPPQPTREQAEVAAVAGAQERSKQEEGERGAL